MSLVLKARPGRNNHCDSEKAASRRAEWMGGRSESNVCLCRSLEQRQRRSSWGAALLGKPRPDPPLQAWEALSYYACCTGCLSWETQLGYQPSQSTQACCSPHISSQPVTSPSAAWVSASSGCEHSGGGYCTLPSSLSPCQALGLVWSECHK